MKHFRKSRILSIMLAVLIMAGYIGFGLSEHICYTQNERFLSLSFKSPACDHQNAEPCCQEHEIMQCELDQACCSVPASDTPEEMVLDAVCCVDGFQYHNLGEKVVLTTPSLKILNIELVLLHHSTVKPDISVVLKGQPIYQYKSPPVPQLRTLLLHHQLRLDPDLA